MLQFTYPATIRQDEEGFFVVTFPDIFPDISFAATDARSLKETLAEAEDCLKEAIAVCISDGLAIPGPPH